MKRILALLASICLTPLLAGCPAQNADAVAISGVGGICNIILTNDGKTAGAAQCLTISGQLATAIKNLIPGSTTQNIIQLGDSLVAIIQADTNSKAADEIAIILGTVLNIVGEYTDTTVAGIAAPQLSRPAINAPRTKAELYAAYNAALAAKPVPGLKPLK